MLPTKKELKRLKKDWKRFAKRHPLTAPTLVPFHTQRLTSFPTPRAWGEPGAGKSSLLMLDDMAEFATLAAMGGDPEDDDVLTKRS